MAGSWVRDDLLFSQNNDSGIAYNCSMDGDFWLNTNNSYTDMTGKECRLVNEVATQCRCEFVTKFQECIQSMGYLDYTKHMYCLYGPEGVPSVVAMSVMWLLVLFAGLGVTANDFLCPSLFIISKTLKMSQNVAGVTLLAFGNGSPDIFSAMAGIQQGKNEMVIGGLIGGGIFVTTVVAGSIFLTQNFSMMKRPFLRDVFFYMTAAGAAFYLYYSRQIYIYHAIGFVMLYILYIIVVVASRYIHQKHLERTDKAAEAANAEKGVKIKGTRAADYDNPEAYGVVLTAFFKYSWEEDRRRNTLHHFCYDNDVFAISIPGIEAPPPSYEETELKTYAGTSSDCSPGCDYYKTSKDVEKVRPPPPVNQWWDFVEKVCPVNIQEWSRQSWMERCLDILKAPVLFVILITTPVVDYKSPRDNWCRILNSLHLITGPLFVIFGIGQGTVMIGGVFPIWALVLILSVSGAFATFYFTVPETTPRFHTVFAYVGFFVAVVWIYCIANEIVVLLQAVGIAFNLSESILGLTILAWGNCLLDFLSNLAVARKGFPRMGIAACFGAPFLTLLLGVGIPCIIKLAKPESEGGMELNYTPLTTILFAALAASLVSSVITMIVCRFQTKRGYGVYLICLYLTFLVLAVLKESHIY